ncbi:MAG: N-acetylglutamate synthase-like GNAT family acetyltransferase [Sphingobacteriales bacterium]|jgi:N-acetylglutamate synthase-like GNAT family acetyltransferase
MQVTIAVANLSHTKYATDICNMMSEAAKIRGTGIAKREPEYISLKISEGKAVIAMDQEKVIGFCYIESWQNQGFVANSGLIVHPDYRKTGLAKDIKKLIFAQSIKLFPKAKLFGITTSKAVMKINSDLGYKPTTFSELTTDEKFWNGCKTCTNYDILTRTNKSMCLCTAMVCDLDKLNPSDKKSKWEDFKQFLSERTVRRKKRADEDPQLKNLMNNEK